MNNKIFLTWQDIENDVKKFTANKKYTNVKNIYGIPRGGLVIAVLVSHYLNKPLITSVKDITKDTLIVDDISDSGVTLKNLFKTFPRRKKPKVFTSWIGPKTKFTPDYFFYVKRKNDWIVFPWETLKTSKLDRINKK
jgi:hypoxanthine phosphoribosyltransferase